MTNDVGRVGDVAGVAGRLTEAQRNMLGEPFYIDGWHNRRFLIDAIEMRNLGLVTERDGGDEQYTQYIYTPTPLALAVRAHLKDNENG